MATFAILLDAGFVKARLGTREKPTSADSVQKLVDGICSHPKLVEQNLYRVYFYDAPPFSRSKKVPLGGGRRDFAQDPLTEHNETLLNELKNVDYFALRTGEVRFRGWKLRRKLPDDKDSMEITAEDLAPNIVQKGVDMRIGLDIASLALKKQVDILVLVTGDSDFVPPMKFARREGVQFALVALGHKVHPDLKEHADFSLEIDM